MITPKVSGSSTSFKYVFLSFSLQHIFAIISFSSCHLLLIAIFSLSTENSSDLKLLLLTMTCSKSRKQLFELNELLFYFCISMLPLATLCILNIFIFYLFLRVWDLPLWCYKQLHYKSSHKFSITGISQNYCCSGWDRVFLWRCCLIFLNIIDQVYQSSQYLNINSTY